VEHPEVDPCLIDVALKAAPGLVLYSTSRPQDVRTDLSHALHAVLSELEAFQDAAEAAER
jgi:hypothetical protein